MTLQTMSAVRAAHDIHRGRRTVVKHGWRGKVVDAHQTWDGTSYAVEFAPKGKKRRGTTVVLVGLTEGDVLPD